MGRRSPRSSNAKRWASTLSFFRRAEAIAFVSFGCESTGFQASPVAVDSDDGEAPTQQTEYHRLSDAVDRTGDHHYPPDFFVGVLQIPFHSMSLRLNLRRRPHRAVTEEGNGPQQLDMNVGLSGQVSRPRPSAHDFSLTRPAHPGSRSGRRPAFSPRQSWCVSAPRTSGRAWRCRPRWYRCCLSIDGHVVHPVKLPRLPAAATEEPEDAAGVAQHVHT